MEQSKSSVIWIRFVRTFIATLIPVVSLELAKGYDLSNPADLKKFALSLVTPLFAAGILALDKWARWEEPDRPVEIDEVPSKDEETLE